MTKKIALALLCCLALPTPHSTLHAYTEMVVPENVYQWVQSSSRINYFFNRGQLSYVVRKDGTIDLNLLKVPVVKSYDDLQCEDVMEKRRWRGLPTDGFEDLSGEANYVTLDLAKGLVTVNAVELLDSQMWTLERREPRRVVDLSRLSPKSREAAFYKAVMEYEAKHRRAIAAHSKGVVRKEDEALLDAGTVAAPSAEPAPVDGKKILKKRKKKLRQNPVGE